LSIFSLPTAIYLKIGLNTAESQNYQNEPLAMKM